VKKVTGDALDYIEQKCANRKACNDYFLGLNHHNPVSLRQVLEKKTLNIYRQVAKEGVARTAILAGFTDG
jgi:hypothetical protein